MRDLIIAVWYMIVFVEQIAHAIREEIALAPARRNATPIRVIITYGDADVSSMYRFKKYGYSKYQRKQQYKDWIENCRNIQNVSRGVA